MRKIMIVLAGWLVLGTSAYAQVHDDGGFFSPAAVSQANSAIQNIKQTFKKDARIETFKSIPASLAEKSTAEGAKFFPDWAAHRASTLKVDGIYVLICKEPAKLEVEVDRITSKKAFSALNRDKLVATLLGNFKEKAFDQGLAEAISQVRLALEHNLGPVAPSPALNVVHDHARLFSPESVTRADAEIKVFKDRFKKDLVIETFAQPPPDQKKLLDGGADKNKVFGEWLNQRERMLKAGGIHVLICKNPPHVQVGVTDSKSFTPENRDQLVKTLVARFREEDFDGGLADGLAYIDQAVRKNATAPTQIAKQQTSVQKTVTPPVAKADADSGAKNQPPIAQSSPPEKTSVDKLREAASDNTVKWVLIGVAGLIGLWVFIGIIRALTRSGRNAPPARPSYQGSQTPPMTYPPPGANPARPGLPPQPAGYGQQATGYAQPAPGYGPPAGPAYPVGAPQAQAGGGFFPSVLGGMFGAAAGGWLLNRFGGGGSTTTIHQPYPHDTQPVQPPTAVGPGYSGSTEDLANPASPGYASSGGDFGAAEGQDQYAGSGGDFGAPAPSGASATSGGDFDQSDQTAADADGDVSGENTADAPAETGADWGASAAEPAPPGGAAGNAGGDTPASTGDWGAADATSGAAGGTTGGDWGSAGGDTSGGTGGTSPTNDTSGGADWGSGSSGGDAGGGGDSSSGGDTGA